MHEAPSQFRPNPKLVRALDVLFILHAEHELNCSTSAMRHLTSSNVDVYTAISAAAGALYGPRHGWSKTSNSLHRTKIHFKFLSNQNLDCGLGGANEAVLRMLEKIGSVDNIPSFIEKCKSGKEKLMGFGHRVYKNYDPRAKIVRKIAEEVFAVCGREELIDVAMKLENIALTDEYFKKRNLYPNVDFYSGLIYKAMGFPTDMFPILFAIPRLAGWLSHWSEWLDDPENRIYRPFQIYKGIDIRDYEGIQGRSGKVKDSDLEFTRSDFNKRRDASVAK